MASDTNGNMGRDKNKGLDTVIYNYLDLPGSIEKDDKQASYTYAADGRKLLHTDLGGKVTNYVGPYVYEDGKLTYIITEKGRLAFGGDSSHSYGYNVKDHLGNTRLAYSDLNNDNFVTKDEILQVADYYPLGMRYEPVTELGTDNKYLYNGKEEQEDTKWYDYGARMYDAALGRWFVIDPLTDFVPGITPYNYCLNNPVSLIDVDGLYGDRDKDKRKRRRAYKRTNKKPRKYKPARGSRGRNGRKSKGNESGPIQGMGYGVWSPGKPYEEVIVEEPVVEIEENQLSFEKVNIIIPRIDDIIKKDDPWDPDRFRTGRNELPTVFENDHSYISRNKEKFEKWAKAIAENLNRTNNSIQVTVFSAAEQGDRLDNDEYYDAPGVKRIGTYTDLMNGRATKMDEALKKAGINNVLPTQQQFKTGGGANHTILIQIF